MLSESRKKKLALLTKSIVRGDIAKASKLLRGHGRSGAKTRDSHEWHCRTCVNLRRSNSP